MAEEISPEIARFVQDKIDSVEQLNVLLLLKLRPDQVWSVADITRELRSTEHSIHQRLEGLYHRQVLARLPELGGKHRFTPISEECRKAIEDLAVLYHTKPYRIMDLIYSRKNDALQEFADAFKLKGEKK